MSNKRKISLYYYKCIKRSEKADSVVHTQTRFIDIPGFHLTLIPISWGTETLVYGPTSTIPL